MIIELHHNDAVSIQLVSPASGDSLELPVFFCQKDSEVSIQLVSPASGDYIYNHLNYIE